MMCSVVNCVLFIFCFLKFLIASRIGDNEEVVLNSESFIEELELEFVGASFDSPAISLEDSFFNSMRDQLYDFVEGEEDIFSTGIYESYLNRVRYIAIAKLLKGRFANDAKVHQRVFENALSTGSVVLVEILLKISFPFLIQNNNQYVDHCLKCFGASRNCELLSLLGKAGFSANYILDHEFQISPLHFAVIRNKTRFLKVLLRDFPGINLKCTDIDGNTPLHYAKNEEIANILLENDERPFQENSEGQIAPVALVRFERQSDLIEQMPSLNDRAKFLQTYVKGILSSESLEIRVVRESVLENSLAFVQDLNNLSDISNRYINIKFVNEKAVGAGLFKEWVSLIAKRLFMSSSVANDEESRVPPQDSVTLESIDEIEQESESEIEPLESVDADAINEVVLSRESSDSSSSSSRSSDSSSSDSSSSSSSSSSDSSSSSSSCEEPTFDQIPSEAPFECFDAVNNVYTISSKFEGPSIVYRFAGFFIGILLRYNNYCIGVKLAPSLLKLMLGKQLTFEDLQEDDPVKYESLKMMLKPDFDFEAAQMHLISDETIPVTRENVEKFVNEAAVHFMYGRYREQIDSMVEGFSATINPKTVRTFFTVTELQNLLAGETIIDRQDLRSVIKFSRRVDSEMFWAAIDAMTDEELKQLVTFITGITVFPYGGIKNISRISIGTSKSIKFPTAGVCDNELSLPPNISSSEELLKLLRISLSSTFEFYNR